MTSFSRQNPLKSKIRKHRIFWNTEFYHPAKFELKRIKNAKVVPSMQKSRIWEMKGGTYTNKDPGQDSGQRNISYTRYPKNCFTQTYRDLYGDAMLVLTWMSSNMADGNQQKHLLPSFATKA